MGLSNFLPGGQGADPAAGGAAPATGDAVAAAPAAKPDFGQRLGSYFENKYPIAGGLAQAVFGQNTPAPAATPANPGTPPIALPPGGDQPDYSQMIAQNAQPKQGGGLAALLKLFA
jgi:hypothetical protein